MRHLLPILCALCASSCLATSGEIDRAIADITGRIDVVARDAQESSDAARAAWQRGEISYAELEQRLQDIRAATLDSGKEITQDVMDGVKEAIQARPAEVIDAVGGILPGPWGEILGALGVAATALYAKKAATDAAKAEGERLNAARDAARLVRGEATGGQVRA